MLPGHLVDELILLQSSLLLLLLLDHVNEVHGVSDRVTGSWGRGRVDGDDGGHFLYLGQNLGDNELNSMKTTFPSDEPGWSSFEIEKNPFLYPVMTVSLIERHSHRPA